MQVAAILCEYNPFHNGHRYQIQQLKKQGYAVICLMSGNFVQRGAPAITHKWDRAAMALQNGCDLMLELPTPYALCSAEGFGRHAVELFNRTGCVDVMSFGCECGDTSLLMEGAQALLSPAFLEEVKAQMKSGASFPAARQRAMEHHAPQLSFLLSSPNDILGLEYCKALLQTGSPIRPLGLARHMAGHHDTSPTRQFASASYLRELWTKGKWWQARRYTPPSAHRIMKHAQPVGPQDFSQALLYRLRTMTPEELSAIKDVREGLEHRILKSAQTAHDWDSLLSGISTRRYPRTTLQRILFCALLGLDDSLYQEPAYYLRVLGFTPTGAQILKTMKETAQCPVLTKPTHYTRMDAAQQKLFLTECRCTQVYQLALPHTDLHELKRTPIRWG